ncbi:hypothetical protein N7540_010452 [Penicillium herquei]|nr:hypothetical protein N7540_010452 [Penicillium herquei]
MEGPWTSTTGTTKSKIPALYTGKGTIERCAEHVKFLRSDIEPTQAQLALAAQAAKLSETAALTEAMNGFTRMFNQFTAGQQQRSQNQARQLPGVLCSILPLNLQTEGALLSLEPR